MVAKYKGRILSETLVVAQVMVLRHVFERGGDAIARKRHQRLVKCHVDVDVLANRTVVPRRSSRAVDGILYLVVLQVSLISSACLSYNQEPYIEHVQIDRFRPAMQGKGRCKHEHALHMVSGD